MSSLNDSSSPEGVVNLVESAKKAAAFQAVEEHLSPDAKYVGIGSGSTVVYVVDSIASKGRSFYGGMTFIPTGSSGWPRPIPSSPTSTT